MTRFAVGFTLAAFALLSSLPAEAQDASAKVGAEALFNEGRKLMASGDYNTACAKFAASQKLEPGVGTSLNLADCYEKSGRLASAWAQFHDARTAARAAGSKDREQLARDRAQALESRLSYVTITTSSPQRGSIQIMRDGIAVEAAMLGTAIPVDPGKHKLEATSPGKKSWSNAFDVPSAPTKIAIAVPDLDDQPAGSSSASSSDAASTKPGSGQRIAGLALAGVGVVGVAAGTLFGLKARSSWDDAKSHCTSYPYGCGSDGVSLGDDTKQAATLSTVSFVVGGVGLVGGAVLYFTAPSIREVAALSLRVAPRAVVLGGSF
jgi:hypothetical protein